MKDSTTLDQVCVNTLRTLSIDAVQKAKSGHPGTPMGMAPVVYALWQHFLRFDPNDVSWPNRDRFVLSAGHACALLYSALYLGGVKAHGESYPDTNRLAVTLDDLKTFRQAGSRCTGHPEHGWTAGVETTAGPLGQGAAISVGMAISERWLAASYNRPLYPIFNYNVYALCGDGDMMEGITSEAASLAGHLKLSNLCWIYDSNHISIEGQTELAFSEDVAARFVAYGWHVIRVGDANDLHALDVAFKKFIATEDRPSLIIVNSHIGYGSPHKQDTKEAHGEPLGVEEVRLAKQFYGCDPDLQFDVPDGVIEKFALEFGQRGATAHDQWRALLAEYRTDCPALAQQLDQIAAKTLPQEWNAKLPSFEADAKGLATRDSSGKVLNAIATQIPWLLGGAADLSPSTKTRLENEEEPAGDFEPLSDALGSGYRGRNFHFGVREHAMIAIGNGMALSNLRPFVSSFLVFTDYCRAAIRMSAMMKLPLISIWTHDSISMGEDGPTHQPIEHLASLRAMPGLMLLRPADANEVVEAWRIIMHVKDKPVCLVLSRQGLPTIDRTTYASADGVARGAYIIADASNGKPDVLLMATGSEVSLCIKAAEALKAENIHARVVSMPSWDLFESQPEGYREQIMPAALTARVAVEQAATFGWERYTGFDGTIIGMHDFGLSAPQKVVEQHFGFDTDHVVAAARAQVARCKPQSVS